jgi:hypothetical protein
MCDFRSILPSIYLTGVYVPLVTPFLSIIGIMVLIALLIVTPAVRTLISAPRTGIHMYQDKVAELGEDTDLAKVMLDAIPELVALDVMSDEEGEEETKEIQSLLSKTTSAKRNSDNHQRQWRPYAQTGLRSSPGSPRWLTRRHITRDR